MNTMLELLRSLRNIQVPLALQKILHTSVFYIRLGSLGPQSIALGVPQRLLSIHYQKRISKAQPFRPIVK